MASEDGFSCHLICRVLAVV